MAVTRHREEVINVKLADELAARGLDADAESIQFKGRPDVLIDLNGIKLVVEGRHRNSAKSLEADARDRVKKGIGDICLSVLYQDSLYTTKTTKLSQAIQSSSFDGTVFFYGGADIQRTDFNDSSIDELADLIRNVFGLIVQDDIVRSQVDKVERTISEVVDIASTTNLFFKSATVRKRLMSALAISE